MGILFHLSQNRDAGWLLSTQVHFLSNLLELSHTPRKVVQNSNVDKLPQRLSQEHIYIYLGRKVRIEKGFLSTWKQPCVWNKPALRYHCKFIRTCWLLLFPDKGSPPLSASRSGR